MATDLGMYVQVKVTGISQVNDGLDKMAAKAGKAEGSALSLANAIGGIASFAVIKKVMSMADSYASMAARMKLATSSTREFTAVQRHLLDTANSAGRSLSELQNIFIDTNGNLQDMGYSLKDTLKMTDSLSFAFTRNATSAQRAQGALEAWDFALNKKSIDVRTWQRISTAIPTLEVDLARVYGKSLTEIQQLGFAGQLSVEMINNTLLESYDENVKAAKLMGSSIESATSMLSNNFQALVGDIDSGLGATAAVAASIELLSDNIELMLIPATGLAVVGIVKGFTLARGAVIAFNASLMANPITIVVAGLAMGVTTLYALTREAKESAEQFGVMSEAADEVLGRFKELGSIQRKSSMIEYQNKEIEAIKERTAALDELANKMVSQAFKDNSGAHGAMRGVWLKKFRDEIKLTIGMGGDLLEIVDKLGADENMKSGLSEMLIKEIAILDDASASAMRYGQILEDLQKEQGTFVGPFQLSVDKSESQAYLDMHESITQQIMKSNLKGIEGAITYERIYGTLKDIEETEYQTLLIRGRSADAGERLLRQQQGLDVSLKSIASRHAKIGMSALDGEIFDLKELGLSGKALTDAEKKLKEIYGAMTSIGELDVFGDRFKSISEDLAAMQALNKEMEVYGQPSKYNEVSQLTLEFENQSSALYKLSESQKSVLLTQAEMLDSQKQLNEIMGLSFTTEQEIDDLYFEHSKIGMLASELERVAFFRDLDSKAKELAIGMSEENASALAIEVARLKELYDVYQLIKEKDDNDPIQGMKDGLAGFLNEAGTAREAFADATQGALTSMSSGLADFVATGKLNFKDLTASILQDIARIMTQWAIAQAVGGIMGGFSGGGAVSYPYKNAWTGGYIPEYATGGSVIDFSGGGFTGSGGKYEPKGVVHGGEFVFSKERVAQLGLKNLDDLHKGYSTGGIVGGSPLSSGISRNQSAQQDGNTYHISVYNEVKDGEKMDEQALAAFIMRIAKSESQKTLKESQRTGGSLRP